MKTKVIKRNKIFYVRISEEVKAFLVSLKKKEAPETSLSNWFDAYIRARMK